MFLPASPLLQGIDKPVIRQLEDLDVVFVEAAVGAVLHQGSGLLLQLGEIQTSYSRSGALEGDINHFRVEADALEDLGACVVSSRESRGFS